MSNLSPRRIGIPFFLKLILLLLVYVLSLGPVMALYASHRLDGPMPHALTVMYQPARWVRDQTPVGNKLALHDEWWKRQLQRH